MRRPDLLSQVLTVNTALVVATVFAASVAVQLDVGQADGLRTFGVLAVAILASLLANNRLLRRRFAPLESLTATMERVDLTVPGMRARPAPDEPEDVARLREAFNRMLVRLEDERAGVARAVLRAQEAERTRIARDLHDEVNQALTAVSLRLGASAGAAPPELAAELEETQRLAGRAMRELLGLARELRPTALDDLGLLPALRTHVRELGERTGLQTRFSALSTVPELDEDAQLVVYRVVQEALSNVAQHADARSVAVAIGATPDGAMRITVTDDGSGFDPLRKPAQGLGLTGMRERVRLAGARLDLRSAPGAGTTVDLVVPRRRVRSVA
jgi:two-component system sensor histidine kinase UhpB